MASDHPAAKYYSGTVVLAEFGSVEADTSPVELEPPAKFVNTFCFHRGKS